VIEVARLAASAGEAKVLAWVWNSSQTAHREKGLTPGEWPPSARSACHKTAGCFLCKRNLSNFLMWRIN